MAPSPGTGDTGQHVVSFSYGSLGVCDFLFSDQIYNRLRIFLKLSYVAEADLELQIFQPPLPNVGLIGFHHCACFLLVLGNQPQSLVCAR